MSDERPRMASVLGPTGLVLGNVQGQGDFEVRGRVQGDIVLDGRVLVAAGGLVLGTIEAVHIAVTGTVRGDLIAKDGVEIGGSGQVEGNVTSPRVAIEAGAKVRGHLRTGEEPPVGIRRGGVLVPGPPEAEPPKLEQISLGEGPLERERTYADLDEETASEATGDEEAPPAAAFVAKRAPASPKDDAEPRGPGAKRRRRRRRGGDRGAPAEAAGPDTDAAGTSSAHVDETRAAAPPLRPTRPSGPLPPAEATAKEPKERTGDGAAAGKRRSKPLPTFVKGARGHLRG